MTVQPIQLFAPAQLTGSAVTYYTSTNILTRIDKLTFCNQDTGAHQVTVYLVPNGGTAGPTNLITKAYSIGAGATWSDPNSIGQMLGQGGTLQMFADTAADVTVFGSGTQISPT